MEIPKFILKVNKIADSKCWATCWSCNDRYIISIISLKEQKNTDEENDLFYTPTKLIIYDSVAKKVTHRISRYSENLEIDLVTHILEAHPFLDRIVISIDLIGRVKF